MPLLPSHHITINILEHLHTLSPTLPAHVVTLLSLQNTSSNQNRFTGFLHPFLRQLLILVERNTLRYSWEGDRCVSSIASWCKYSMSVKLPSRQSTLTREATGEVAGFVVLHRDKLRVACRYRLIPQDRR
jgi:hypothetical protein